MRLAVALTMKWFSIWVILALFGMVSGMGPIKGAIIALVVSVISWLGDRALPFSLQGVTRWAIDGGLTALGIYLAQFIWPGPGLTFPLALFAGYVIGSVEIPIHMYLASRFGIRRRDDDRDGIR
jgi:hypothetical protein